MKCFVNIAYWNHLEPTKGNVGTGMSVPCEAAPDMWVFAGASAGTRSSDSVRRLKVDGLGFRV